jgi:hypothetical protein
MIELRELIEPGVLKLEQYLHELDYSTKFIPKPNLNIDLYSKKTELPQDIFIDENKKFETRMEIGSYISQKLSLCGIKRGKVIFESQEQWNNVWSWLAYLWLDQFITLRKGVYKVPAISRFIGSSDWNRFYRHFISMPYYIFSLHENYNSKLFLECAPSIHNEFMEQIGSRKWIITSKSLVELAHLLYWDRKKDVPKRGARGKGKGTVRRFGKIINQFRLTYDVHQMDIRELVSLLPSEFDEWKE